MTDTGPDKPQDDPLGPDGEPAAEAGDSRAPTPEDSQPAPEAGDEAPGTAGDAYADEADDQAPAEGPAPAEPSGDTTSEGGYSDDGGNDDWESGYDNYDEWNEGQYDDWGDGFDGEGWRDDDTPDDGYDDHYQDYDYDQDTELTTWQDDNEPARPGPGGTPAKASSPAAVATAEEEEEEEDPDPEDAELAKSTMSLGDHLEELRVRLIKALVGLAIAMVGTCFFGIEILDVLKASYVYAMESNGLKPEIVITGVHEGFLTYFRVSLIAGMVIASPWVFYQIWQFIAAGLYKRERRYVTVAVPFSATLFVCGATFFLLVVSKPMLMFFIGFSKWMGVTPMIKLKEYVGFITMLMLVFGLAFQTPLVVFLLGKMGLVSLATLRKYRRHVIVIFLIIAAVATSPSPVDQILLALPMYLLYELGVFMVVMSEKKKRKEEAAAEEEDRLRSEELARERGEEE